MSKQYGPQWNAFCAAHNGPSPLSAGPSSTLPTAARSRRNGVGPGGRVHRVERGARGAIGYDEYAYAIGDGVPVVKLLNQAGYYSLPTTVQLWPSRCRSAQINENVNDVNFMIQNLDDVYTNSDRARLPAVQLQLPDRAARTAGPGFSGHRTTSTTTRAPR